jgi:hypothetical protein
MPSSTTIFRAVLMLAVGAGVFKGWQMYGPPAEKVKSIAGRAADMAQAAWKNFQGSAKDAQPAVSVPAAAPPFAQAAQQPAGSTRIVSPALRAPTLLPSPPMDAAPIASATSTRSPITPLGVASPPANTTDDRVHALISQLEQLGGTDPKIAAWGSSGHLFRCSCQAPLAKSTAVKQHFESVAAEPELAVKEVLAKVEAWRTAQRSDAVLRY